MSLIRHGGEGFVGSEPNRSRVHLHKLVNQKDILNWRESCVGGPSVELAVARSAETLGATPQQEGVMANVTFSSPVMAKDVTVYAIAGHRGTILSIAKAHKIPIPFDCGDGECGSCVVEVEHTNPSIRYGIGLTEKEKEILKQLGKITHEEIENTEVNDMPPRHRLACQCFVRDEDIRVKFEGDQTLPAKKPAMSIAAAIFAGGIKIRSVEEFLGYAIKVEDEAARHFDELADEMVTCGNSAVAELFRKLAGYSRLHLEEAKGRAGDINVSELMPDEHVWPDLVTPEQTTLWAGDPALSRLGALKAALVGERLGFEFYHHIAETSPDLEIRVMAKEFVKEESEHVAILEQWIEREEAR
jgi:ferredoxin/rubrerythrin